MTAAAGYGGNAGSDHTYKDQMKAGKWQVTQEIRESFVPYARVAGRRGWEKSSRVSAFFRHTTYIQGCDKYRNVKSPTPQKRMPTQHLPGDRAWGKLILYLYSNANADRR